MDGTFAGRYDESEQFPNHHIVGERGCKSDGIVNC
jgi:hypothetical protein